MDFPAHIDPHTLGMADAGEQVRFLDRNGYEGELILARQHMKAGDILTVNRVSIGGWASSYLFEEHGRQWFNTVMFEPVASAIEARRAETHSGSVEDESAASEAGDAR